MRKKNVLICWLDSVEVTRSRSERGKVKLP